MTRHAPIVTWARHRMQCDGDGVTTLVCFHGCPLRCKYCLNPFTLSDNTRFTQMTPQELYEQVKIDSLYFLATGGGVTFGGGEPLLYPDFIRSFRQLCGGQWHICAETSLNVPWAHVEAAAEAVDTFFIDCKDTDPDIYCRYTGKDNTQMLDNLRRLLTLIPPDRIILRIPLIPGFNTEQDQQRSRALLAGMGVVKFDLFPYIIQE